MGSLTLMRIMRNMAVLSGALFFVLLTFPVSAQVRDTVIVTDTSRYVGQFPEGRGVLYSYGNGLYVGEFRNAVPEGKGMHFLPDGSIYAGELSDGKHCGFGRFFSDSGKIFSGEFDDDYANGLDTLWYPDGSVYVGKCVWGRPVSTLSPEYGRMYRGMHVPDYIVSAKPECRKVELTEEQQKFLDGEYRQYKKLINSCNILNLKRMTDLSRLSKSGLQWTVTVRFRMPMSLTPPGKHFRRKPSGSSIHLLHGLRVSGKGRKSGFPTHFL